MLWDLLLRIEEVQVSVTSPGQEQIESVSATSTAHGIRTILPLKKVHKSKTAQRGVASVVVVHGLRNFSVLKKSIKFRIENKLCSEIC